MLFPVLGSFILPLPKSYGYISFWIPPIFNITHPIVHNPEMGDLKVLF